MKARITPFTLLAFAALMLIFVSCKKENNTPVTGNSETAAQFASAEAMFENDAQFADDDLLSSVSGLKSVLADKHPFAPCVTITRDTANGKITRTLDFGTVNCLCNDGKVRRGKIITEINGRRFAAGSSRTTAYDNYYVNDNQVSGSSTVTYNGKNNAGNHTWTSSVDKTITYTTGQSLHWTATRNREWIAGADTPREWTDDVFIITGAASRTGTDGTLRTSTIVIPLRKEMNCHHFVSGSLLIVAEGKPDMLLDYGTGECDDLATITVDGVTRTIKI